MRNAVLIVLTLVRAAFADTAASGVPLGVDYSQYAPPNVRQIATDGSGAIYILSAASYSGRDTPPASVTKLSADGKDVVWTYTLPFTAFQMAVDANGGVYVLPYIDSDIRPFLVSVVKLNTGGTRFAWVRPDVLTLQQQPTDPVIAVDRDGRVYVAAFDVVLNQTKFARITATGESVDSLTTFPGFPTSIAVDDSGSAFVSGYGFLTKILSDGSPGFYISDSNLPAAPAIALDANGDVVVSGNGILHRFNRSGKLLLSRTVATWKTSYPGLSLDADGNAYLLGTNSNILYPVKNSLGSCAPYPGSNLVSIVDRAGSVVQTTYIPGSIGASTPLLVVGRDSGVFLLDASSVTFPPTRTSSPFLDERGGATLLTHLSHQPDAKILPFACLGNAATNEIVAVAPGTIVSLVGSGLGPEQGVVATATFEAPFPRQVANVAVTFDGIPAPLLWVQDRQVNAIVPWALTKGSTTQVCVSYNGSVPKCLLWPLAQVSPGVFSGVLNEDGSVNSANNPARSGTVVSVFATGLGPISPSQADGSLVRSPLPVNLLPLAVYAHLKTVQGRNSVPGSVTVLEWLYAGPAPNLVAGVTQVNVRVTADVTDIYLVQGTTRSPSIGVYIADP